MEDDVLTFDEILEDPAYQAEFDKRVEKAITKSLAAKEDEYKKRESALAGREDEIRQSILEEMEAKAREAEENAKLTEAEKYKKQLDKLTQDNLSLANQVAVMNRQKKMEAYAKEKGYSTDILQLVKAETIKDAEVEDKLDAAHDLVAKAVSADLNEKLKEHPDVLLGDKSKKGEPTFDFGFQSIKPTNN